MAQLESADTSLRAALNTAIPTGVACRFNYLYSQPKECDPLFSPPPGHDSEKTRLASHFLGVSASNTHTHSSDTTDATVLLFGIEVLVYTTKSLTTIFVSKADSTGHAGKTTRVPVKDVCTAFLRWLVQRERQKHPRRQTAISLFARAQAQYLFPGSSEHGGKHTLDDRQLIKWWARVLDPLIAEAEICRAADSTAPHYQGYITVPGYDTTEVRSFFPTKFTATSSRWKAGDPLREMAVARDVSITLPRTLLPRFPDDPKARFIQDLDDEVGLVEDTSSTTSPTKRRNGQWKNIHDLSRFWEAMEFRQECSSGRVVGFLWLLINPSDPYLAAIDSYVPEDVRASLPSISKLKLSRKQQGSRKKALATAVKPQKPRTRLTGPIIVRKPRPKGISTKTQHPTSLKEAVNGVDVSAEGYDQVMHTLLHLDFGHEAVSIQSTQKWTEEIASICGQPKRSWGVELVGTAARAPIIGTTSAPASAHVNDLGSMIRKKRKNGEENATTSTTISEDVTPAVNSLGTSVVRKKPKTTTST